MDLQGVSSSWLPAVPARIGRASVGEQGVQRPMIPAREVMVINGVVRAAIAMAPARVENAERGVLRAATAVVPARVGNAERGVLRAATAVVPARVGNIERRVLRAATPALTQTEVGSEFAGFTRRLRSNHLSPSRAASPMTPPNSRSGSSSVSPRSTPSRDSSPMSPLSARMSPMSPPNSSSGSSSVSSPKRSPVLLASPSYVNANNRSLLSPPPLSEFQGPGSKQTASVVRALFPPNGNCK